MLSKALFRKIAFPILIAMSFLYLFFSFTNAQVWAATSESQERAGSVIYVAKTGNASDGSSWTNAYTDLQDALGSATSGDEIWVAQGVYTPGVTVSDTFGLVSEVDIYGGFAATETLRTQRDWLQNVTVLSGDLFGDDGVDFLGVVTNTNLIFGLNARHVISATNLSSNTVLDGFVVTAGYSSGPVTTPCLNTCGGGMFNNNGSPILKNLTFSGNASLSGAGMYNRSGHPTLSDVLFIHNTAAEGAGMYNASGSQPTLIRVQFVKNDAQFGGGGMHNDASNPLLFFVDFERNEAGDGGGMYNYESAPVVRDSRFIENYAGTGGGVYNGPNSVATFTNIQFLGNTTASYGGGWFDNNGSPWISNAIFVGNTAQYGGGIATNASEFGQLINLTFSANEAEHGGGIFTSISDFHLYNTIFWNNFGITAGDAITATLPSADTITFTNVLVSEVSCPFPATCEGSLWTSTDPLFSSSPNAGDGDWTTFDDNDYGNLRLTYLSPVINGGNDEIVVNNSLYDDLDGNPRIVGSAVDLGAYEAPAPAYLFVDDTAGGLNTGVSWDDAYTDLQDALARAGSGSEIWVATGVYTPGATVSDTFVLVPGVEIYGGFAATETLRTERDSLSHPTVLSGDIQGDDTKFMGVVSSASDINGLNNYHVISATNVLSDTVLDGFTITAGSAIDASWPHNGGGGILAIDSKAGFANLKISGNQASLGGGGMLNFTSGNTLSNVEFVGNSSAYGAGMYNYQSDALYMEEVYFNFNYLAGIGDGAGIYNFESSPTINNAVFYKNTANGNGGGMYNYQSNPVVTGFEFIGNLANLGGGVYNEASSPVFQQGRFATNVASGAGGAMYNDGGQPNVTNAVFVANLAIDLGGTGGAIYNWGSAPELTNLTFAHNTATDEGGALFNNGSTLSVRNSIFWDNAGDGDTDTLFNFSSTVTLTHALIEEAGCPTGTNCFATLFNTDPLFVRDPDAGDGSWGTLLDNDYGDLQLRSGSQAIDAGNNGYVLVSEDLLGNDRIVGSAVDLGAYEFFYRVFLPLLIR